MKKVLYVILGLFVVMLAWTNYQGNQAIAARLLTAENDLEISKSASKNFFENLEKATQGDPQLKKVAAQFKAQYEDSKDSIVGMEKLADSVEQTHQRITRKMDEIDQPKSPQEVFDVELRRIQGLAEGRARAMKAQLDAQQKVAQGGLRTQLGLWFESFQKNFLRPPA